MSDHNDDQLSIKDTINRRVRECLIEMKDKPPRDRNALAMTVETLLKARPLAADDGYSLLDALQANLLELNKVQGLRAVADESEKHE